MKQMQEVKLVTNIIYGKAATTTRILAEKLGYTHEYLMKRISNLACSPQFKKLNFSKRTYLVWEDNYYGYEYAITLNGILALGIGYRRFKEYSKEIEELIISFAHHQTKLNLRRMSKMLEKNS